MHDVKLCNDTITVFNAHFDETAGDDIYYPTAIAGVRWYMTQAETVDPKGGLVMANRITIRIPTNARAAGLYVDPIAYRLAEEPSGMWTLAGGTIIVKGTLPTPATRDATAWTPKLLRETFPECMTVLGVTDNRGAPNAPHFKVVGA